MRGKNVQVANQGQLCRAVAAEARHLYDENYQLREDCKAMEVELNAVQGDADMNEQELLERINSLHKQMENLRKENAERVRVYFGREGSKIRIGRP
jgi:DNA anti-recombination protein RmuC